MRRQCVFALSQWMWLSVLALARAGRGRYDQRGDTFFAGAACRRPTRCAAGSARSNFLFINACNQLGQFESGVTAALFGTMPAAVLGGVGTIAIALLWMKLFPALRKVEQLE